MKDYISLQEKIAFGYDFMIDPKKNHGDAVDVILVTLDGQRYYSNFITRRFIINSFEKNARTGECANGSFFTMPNLVIVRELERDTIEKTIESLIKSKEINECFKLID